MSLSRARSLASLLTVGALACSEPTAYVSAPLCDGAVTVAFSRRAGTIAWSPSCGISEVVVFDVDAARTVWGMSIPEDRPLAPALRYGQAPPQAEVWVSPSPLQAGRRYSIMVGATVGRDVSVGGGRLEFTY